MSSNKNSSKLIVSGEDVESEDEEIDTTQSPSIAVTDVDGNIKKSSSSTTGIKIVTFGENSTAESDYEEFGSTISLDSTNSLELDPTDDLLKLDPEAAAVLAPILPQRRSPRLDPSVVKKHREKNKSLRTNISDKFLTPVVLQSAKKFEKLSQNLSNSQMQMQDALFQSRISTGNLLKLQKELEIFLEEDYMNDLQIFPSDQVSASTEEGLSRQDSTISSNNSALNSTSLLTSALSGGAHLI